MISDLQTLAVACDESLTDELQEYARQLAQELSLPLLNLTQEIKWISEFDYLLLLSDDQSLAIAKTGKGAPAPVKVDFASGAVAHRRLYGGGKGQDIAKAIGLNKKNHLTVFDATAGLGRDAFVLATLGCEVSMFERVPFVRALLKSGLTLGLSDSEVGNILARMHLMEGTLANYHADDKADVIYLDPMFPHTDKSAAVKKEMAFFRDLIGHDEDADQLLPIALSKAVYRVVVKRPKAAPFLNNQQPTYQLKGKSGRFDIYVLKSLDDL